MIRLGAAIGVALALGAGAAAAQTTSLRMIHPLGDPQVSLMVPAGVQQETSLDAGRGVVMAFFTKMGEEDFGCFLYRVAYTAQADRAVWIKALASDRANLLCKDASPAVSAYQQGAVQATKIGGSPASVCQAIYTKSDQAKPGVAVSSLTVAAPGAAYKLLCKLSAIDQLSAEAAWASDSDDIGAIEGSLKLPKK